MVDFITKLPIVAGKDAILVVCDRLSKMTHFVATMEGTSAEGLARSFRDNVTWIARKYSVRQETTVCSRDNKGVE